MITDVPAKSDNHFITVSRWGELMARRKGRAPVKIADAEHGLVVHPPEHAVARGVPAVFRAMFKHGGKNRELHLTEIVVEERHIGIGAFQIEYVISDEELGHWLRTTVDAALDAAGS